jgi:beta-lactam-binding protein with PASTA domain
MAGARVSVPDLTGFGWEEAREMARAAGFSPRAVGPDGQPVNGKGGVVVGQAPESGRKVPHGSDLALRVAFGGGPGGDREPREPSPRPREFTERRDLIDGPEVPGRGPFHREREPELVPG